MLKRNQKWEVFERRVLHSSFGTKIKIFNIFSRTYIIYFLENLGVSAFGGISAKLAGKKFSIKFSKRFFESN